MSENLSQLPLVIRFARATQMICTAGEKTQAEHDAWYQLTGYRLITVGILKDMAQKVSSPGIYGLRVKRVHVQNTFAMEIDASEGSHHARLAMLPDPTSAQYWLLGEYD